MLYCVEKKGACPTLALEWKMDEFISTMSLLPVSNCLDGVSLWIPLINHLLALWKLL
jgi:hypothetical protein